MDEALVSFSPQVVRIRFQFGEDWIGAPALFSCDHFGRGETEDNLHPTARRVYKAIDDRINSLGLEVQSHFNFRSVSEQRDLRDSKWE